jgi:hypothetical protein
MSVAQIKHAFATSASNIGHRDCTIIQASALQGFVGRDSLSEIFFYLQV